MKLPQIIATALALLFLVLIPTSALAQEQQNNTHTIEQELQKIMAQQAPLVEDDIRFYLTNVDPIFRLRFEPDKLADTIASIGVWPEERFVYVTTKMAVGMSLIMRFGDPRNNDIPDFVRPTDEERKLIEKYKDELTRAMTLVQARYATASGL